MSVPSVLRVNATQDGGGTQQSQRIESFTIEPQTITGGANGGVRFLLPQKGVLNSGSYITMSLVTANGNQCQCLSLGILALISQATLYVGNKIICQQDFANQLLDVRQKYKPMDLRMLQDNVLYGTASSFFTGGVNAGGGGPAAATAFGGLGGLIYDGRNAGVTYNATGLVGTLGANLQWTNTTATAEHQVSLAVLFPGFARNLQLPLGIMAEPVTLEIRWCGDAEGDRVVPVAAAAFAAGNLVDTAKVKFCADLLFWDSKEDELNVMDALAKEMNSGDGITFAYDDYVSVQSAIPQVTGGQPAAGTKVQQTIVRQLGFKGQTLRHLIIKLANLSTTATIPGGGGGGGNFLLGKYNGIASQGVLSVQIRVNERPYYPIPVASESRHYQELSEVFGMPIHLASGQYTFDNSVLEEGATQYNVDVNNQQMGGINHTMNGHAQSVLNGTSQVLGCNFAKTRQNIPGDGILIGTAPVEITLRYDRTNQNYGPLTMYAFGAVERSFQLKNGIVHVSGA
jgi:hypothetical protein